MIDLALPYPYLCAVAARVVTNFDELPLPAQQTLADEVKSVALCLYVNVRPLADYSDRELLLKNALDELPVDAWEAAWRASLEAPIAEEPAVRETPKPKPVAPVATAKKEKK